MSPISLQSKKVSPAAEPPAVAQPVELETYGQLPPQSEPCSVADHIQMEDDSPDVPDGNTPSNGLAALLFGVVLLGICLLCATSMEFTILIVVVVPLVLAFLSALANQPSYRKLDELSNNIHEIVEEMDQKLSRNRRNRGDR
jgi:hypothetical protein